MESRLSVQEDVRFRDCRNDEGVDMAPSMPLAAWMIDGEIGFGSQSWQRRDPSWLTFYSEETGDGFATVRLDYECTHPHFPAPAAVAIHKRHWVRCPLRNAILRRGDFIHERNAYVTHRYAPGRERGFGMLMDTCRQLSQPLVQADEEAPRRRLSAAAVMDALRDCRDLELYLDGSYDTARTPNFVDLGFIRDVRVDGVVVHVTHVLPYAGRSSWLDWFTETMVEAIQRRVEGVREVRTELATGPAWRPDQIDPAARRRMGL